jgi:predicted ester cyclase
MIRFCFAALLVLAGAGPAAAGPAENKAVAARVLLERMGQGRFELDAEIYGPGFVAHGFGRDFTLAEDRASGERLRAAFPDLAVRVDRIVAEGDLVAVHWSAEGTNSVAVGMYPGTGRRGAIDGMSFFRFSEGRIVEEWSTYDNLSIMRQLGLVGS